MNSHYANIILRYGILAIIIGLLIATLILFIYNSHSAKAEIELSSEEIDLSTVELIVEKSITIWSDAKPTMAVGDIVTLYSEVKGIEESSITCYQWQQYVDGAWEDIAGANSSTYSFPASIESLKTPHRLRISFTE